ncbi:MAG TPA: hypothetical protein VG710_18890 [Opitutus sp.]|nr:hypothetical protein [Opitutus sp.]
MKLRPFFVALLASLAAFPGSSVAADTAPAPNPPPSGKYRNFSVAIYIPVSVVNQLADPKVLAQQWRTISSQLKVDKVYIESQRSREVASDATLEAVKKFFLARGVRVAGGITFSDRPEHGQFRSFCYTDPADRAFVKSMAELTARHFDEIILDDFFFVTTKNPSDIAAKGRRSWTQFRLDLMDEVGRNLVVGAAKAVNPNVRVTIKYPNWYEHFQGLGFDLAEGPKIFDGIYTGTETRDPGHTDQFLQQYESYEIIRYFDNIAPGRNGGGWVDTFGTRYIDRYAEQLWDTMFAKAREMTLFFWGGLLAPVRPGDRDAWHSAPTSFDYDAALKYHPPGVAAADIPPEATMARAAGYALDQADAIVGQLGHPIGLKSYRPPHGIGEDFLHNYLGMLGIPVELEPAFPDDADVVLLTADAQTDPDIVAKIKTHLLAGKSVVITSGLLQALKTRGIDDIVELELSGRRFFSDGYSTGFFPPPGNVLTNDATRSPSILFPQVGFLTNDAWALVNAMSNGVGYPLLLTDRYGERGNFYVWTIPDNFHDLYDLPPAITSKIKDTLMRGFPVRLDGPSQVALFAYDNHTIVVESYRPDETTVKIGALAPATRLRDLVSGEITAGIAPPPVSPRSRAVPSEARTSFEVRIAPHSYRAFAIEP